MILTEEELKKIEDMKNRFHCLGYEESNALIISHRLLLAANAELSFRNGKLLREVEYLRSNYELKEETK